VLILHLEPGDVVDPRPHLQGCWKGIQLWELLEGQAPTAFGGPAEEVTAYVIDGSGTATIDGGDVVLSPGTAFTLTLGTKSVVKASSNLRLFVVTLATR
jgi:uncharacterized cupin superfamily protein